MPRLHPRLADLYREKIERLHEELNRPELRAEAAGIIRSMIDEVKLVPENGKHPASNAATVPAEAVAGAETLLGVQ